MPTAPCILAIFPSCTLSVRTPCSLLHPSSPHKPPTASLLLPLWPSPRLLPAPHVLSISPRSPQARFDTLSASPGYPADHRTLYFRRVGNEPGRPFYRTACPDQY